jgi:hypothetical protein
MVKELRTDIGESVSPPLEDAGGHAGCGRANGQVAAGGRDKRCARLSVEALMQRRTRSRILSWLGDNYGSGPKGYSTA